MNLLALFAICFIAGPIVFLLSWRHFAAPHTLALFALLCVFASTVLAGIAQPWAASLSLGMIWLGWICVLAAGAQTCAQIFGGPRLSRMVGAVGVTLPWFGFATAQWMVG